MIIFKIAYYTYRNLVYYRVHRPIDRVLSTGNFRLDLTNNMLASVGLKVVSDDSQVVPWYIPLSRIQRDWIRDVSQYGFKVGLT